MATCSSVPAWKIPWTGEPGRLQSMDCKESDMTEQLTHTQTKIIKQFKIHINTNKKNLKHGSNYNPRLLKNDLFVFWL